MFQRCYLQRTADESWECGTDLLKSGHSGYGGWFAAKAAGGRYQARSQRCYEAAVQVYDGTILRGGYARYCGLRTSTTGLTPLHPQTGHDHGFVVGQGDAVGDGFAATPVGLKKGYCERGDIRVP
jgi:hypothetical protein